ncbi:MAG: HTTM domain-containing protein [candidate division Zixibacteria bacterium]|nr:HTTM domain-containing protein [candidate division Zixibacteria bacterium]
MKLRDKEAHVWFRVKNPKTGEEWQEEPGRYFTKRQVQKMGTRPDMMLQFAHFLANEYQKIGYPDVEVYAETEVSLNGRARQKLIDPETDLAAQPRTLSAARWIVPLTQPLGNGGAGHAASKEEDGGE